MAQQKVLLSGLRIHTETFTLDLEENQTLVNRWDGKVSREAYQALLTLVTSDSFPTGEHYLVDAQQGVKSHWMVRIDKDGTQIGTFLISGLCPGQVHQVLRIIENQLPPSYRFPLPMKKPGL
ncbi:MAG TPA: hypothetical protein PK014_12515 [Thermoanaerobaculia bacterium]|nr:hypothetical protein [Thermoanaerobaculia bacterium]HUM30902.1 hypothetical protein [Thermoanaerobaculia bacterium]HXK69212.1 hypothetical protein [Thermoanaerobaculia bacterium]